MAEKLDQLHTATVAVREWEGEVIFLHEVRPGTADCSYGVQVARLAGLPESVIARAREVLEKLEASEREGGTAGLADALPLAKVGGTDPVVAAAIALIQNPFITGEIIRTDGGGHLVGPP